MKKVLFVSLLVFAFSFLAVAQDAPKAEVFGGYQYTSVDFGADTSRESFNGWNGALSGFFNNNFGITADFSGAYKSISGTDVKLHTYMFGPTLRAPMDKATVFAHALFGGAHVSASGASGESAFAYAFGGGLDFNASKNFGIRVGQFDYLGTRFTSENQKHFRYSAGVVFKF